MGETNSQKQSKLGGFFTGLSAEFKKVMWPDKVTLLKQTVTVTVASVVLGLLIALIDTIVQYGVNFLTM
ncbi:MAG: preprotein translocase subunit SecE [Lachnospiraceae bacterium]|nr:preprotein translocase subunit SecE [Lachnospiraceae bacterium]